MRITPTILGPAGPGKCLQSAATAPLLGQRPLFAYFGPGVLAPLAFLGEDFINNVGALRVYQAAPLLGWGEALAFLLSTKSDRAREPRGRYRSSYR